jgi:lysine 2,3-aminomutase
MSRLGGKMSFFMEILDVAQGEGSVAAPTKAPEEVSFSSHKKARRLLDADLSRNLRILWTSNPQIHEILKYSDNKEISRDKLFTYLENKERVLLHQESDLHSLERANARECIKVFKSVISPLNERQTGVSALDTLFRLSHNDRGIRDDVGPGFILEFIHLFRGVIGKSGIYGRRGEQKKLIPQFLRMKGRKAANKRAELLDHFSEKLE